MVVVEEEEEEELVGERRWGRRRRRRDTRARRAVLLNPRSARASAILFAYAFVRAGNVSSRSANRLS